MDIIKINGGLGNQMFQYAFMYAVSKEKGTDFQLDTFVYNTNDFRKFELFDLFNLSCTEIAKQKIIAKYSTTPSSLIKKIRRRYCPKRTHLVERSCRTNPKVYSPKIHYYDGFFQNVRYIEKYRQEILKEYEFKKKLTLENIKFFDEMKGTPFCTVHIRGTDYLSYPGFNICSKSYYEHAINLVQKEFPNIKFVILSDDISYAKNNFSLPDNSVFVTWNNTKDSSWQDMYIMKSASVNIIANSTFSWWGAYLGEKKKIYCPSIWCNKETSFLSYFKYEYPDIYPENWIKLNVF